MIAEIADRLPSPLKPFGAMVAVGAGLSRARPARALFDGTGIDGVLARFGEPYRGADARAILSFWSLYYLGALIIPAATALLCLGRVLPVALDTVGFEPDAQGKPKCFWLADAGFICQPNDERLFVTLVEGHLRPMIALCAAHVGLAPRVLWSNAGTMLDFIVRELAATREVRDAPLREAETLLGMRGDPRRAADNPLFQPLRTVRESGVRKRRVCCLRYRLPGVDACEAVCPANPRSTDSC